MSFGDGIRSLLDTYANCISLLKAFGRAGNDNRKPTDRNERSRLRKSLRRDRSLIEQTYSSRLSESGSRLSKGDARALRALDRILKRLRGAITNLLRLSSNGDRLDLDYNSLMALSNASRVDAIRAIDGLSRRLASSSRSRVSVSSSKASKASSKGAPKTKPPQHQRRSSPSTATSSLGQSRAVQQKHSKSTKVTGSSKNDKRNKGEEKTDSRGNHRNQDPEGLPPLQRSRNNVQARVSETADSKPRSPRPFNTPALNRISIMSFSSDSTKLGEIPERKWRSAMRYSGSGGEDGQYNIRPVFPLTPYTVEVKERRFFGLFSRKRETDS